MTSCRPAPDACRLAWMAGAATLTTDASSSAMNWPVRTIARIAPGLGARRWAARAGPVVARVLVMNPAWRSPDPGTKSLVILVPAPPGNRRPAPAGWVYEHDDRGQRAAAAGRARRLPAQQARADQPRAGRARARHPAPHPRPATC